MTSTIERHEPDSTGREAASCVSEKYALLIVDMQKDFVLPGGAFPCTGAAATIPRIKRILEAFRHREWPIFHVVRAHRGDGSDVEITRRQAFLKRSYAVPGTRGFEIVDDLQPLAGEYRIKKNRFSAFMNTELDTLLKKLRIDHVVVCGTRCPTCIRCTVFDAVAHDFRVTLLSDAASAQDEEISRANIRDMADIGVHCMAVDEFLSSLQR